MRYLRPVRPSPGELALSALVFCLHAGCGDDSQADVGALDAAISDVSTADSATDASSRDAGADVDSDMPDASSTRDAGGSDVFDAGISDELKAFPGAFGAGSVITGGRGGQVIPVTRLDDAFDGYEPVEGTLRYALTREFPRTIVFRVSGSIIIGDTDGDGIVDRDVMFPTMLYVFGQALSNATIAGQTDPLGGVTIVGYIYGGDVNNLIWRYLRVRKPSSTDEFGFPAVALDRADDLIFDHMSVAYGSNESLNMGPRQMDGLSRSSVQYNIIGLGNASTIIGRTNDGDTDASVSFHNNFMAQLTHRTPNLAGNADSEVINNLVYNWAFRLVNVHNGPRLNHIANAYVAGPHTGDRTRILNKIHTGTSDSEAARIYSARNYVDGFLTDVDADNWSSWTDFPGLGDPVSTSRQVATPFPMLGSPIPIRTFRTLDENGNIQIFRDSIDEQLISDYRSGVETAYGYPSTPEGFVFPEIPSNEPYPDRDGDGMPDAWEAANGFDPDLADDAGDADGDGYTNLEEFLGLVDRRP